MKTQSLDRIYIKLDKHINVARGYSEIKELPFIIKSCRLKPNKFHIRDKTKLYYNWIDEFGSSISFEKKRKTTITLNDLRVNRSKLITTDLYNGLSIYDVFKISSLLYMSLGKDEDCEEEYAIIALLGIDNYLRVYQLYLGEWQQISPLYLGLNNLKFIAKNNDIKYYLKLNKKQNCGLPCLEWTGWLTCIPLNHNLLENLKEKHSYLLNQIGAK